MLDVGSGGCCSPTSFPPSPKQTKNLNFWADELCGLVLLEALDPVQLVQAQPGGLLGGQRIKAEGVRPNPACHPRNPSPRAWPAGGRSGREKENY